MIWAQWTILVIYALHLILAINRNGKQRHDAHWSPADVFISIIAIVILAAAGTFSHIIGWPH